ncbi:MAG: HAMP domain-containing histidine kinase [Candidatus Eremiobacteraeota bacterium]|nr:HAMP domain-containing histidine kinase [Candidatus Eremiobacteraeota bacterium]
MRAFASRLARTNVIIIAVFTLIVMTVTTFVLLLDSVQLTARDVGSTRSAIESIAYRYLDLGVPLAQAARNIASEIETNPQVSYAIFDNKGKLLAGDPSLRDQGQKAAAFMKMLPLPPLGPPSINNATVNPVTAKSVQHPPAGAQVHNVIRSMDVRVGEESGGPIRPVLNHHLEALTHFMGGGYAIVVGNVGLISSGAWRYAAVIAILGGLAMLLTWFLTKRQARLVVAPVESVAGALRRLATGDFSRFTTTAEEEHDAGGLFSAYNSAAATAAAAVSDRERLEANMRQFVADAGHELRTPLTVIMGYIDVLNRGAIAEQALARRILDTMSSEGERMRILIAKLLTLARLENMETRSEQRLNIGDLARKVVEAARPLADGSVLRFAEGEPLYAFADEAELREAFSNIIDNALKYAGGSTIETSIARNGDQVIITIKDNGPGMAEDERAHAFERFFRGGTNRDIPGSGLGLAIAKRSVERAHGTIGLDSAPHEGTQVTIRLPLASPP